MRALPRLAMSLRHYSSYAKKTRPVLPRTTDAAAFTNPCEVERYLHSVKNTLPLRAQQMLDDGVLHQCNPSGQTWNGREVLEAYIGQCQDAEERQEAVVCFSILLSRYRLSLTCCQKCLYPMERCICDCVRRVVPRHHLWLFQHAGEYGRNNNTGSLLCLMAGAQRAIRGIREQQKRMLDHIERNRTSTVILFPNKSSTTLDEYRRDRVVSMGSKGEGPLTLVLLDGTSRQAKNFDRFMPSDIPRVRIRETSVRSWLDPIRRQTEEHRVCTAQAAAMILSELGDEDTSEAIESAVRSVLKIAEMRRYSVSLSYRKEKRYPSNLFG